MHFPKTEFQRTAENHLPNATRIPVGRGVHGAAADATSAQTHDAGVEAAFVRRRPVVGRLEIVTIGGFVVIHLH